MKSALFLFHFFILVSISICSVAQTNLIRNSGFENGNGVPKGGWYSSTPGFWDASDSKAIVFTQDLTIGSEITWSQTGTNTSNLFSPDWYDSSINDANNVGVPPGNPSNRVVRMGGNSQGHEGIFINLQTALKKGIVYTFRIKMGGAALTQIRVHLAKQGVNWNQDGYGNVKQSDVVGFTSGGPGTTVNGWYSYSGAFQIDDDKDGVLGNLIIIAEVGSVYIDDVELYGNGECDGTLNIENKTFTFNEAPYKAKIINAGYDVGDPPVGAGNVVVKSDANVKYKAIEKVVLSPGFIVEKGATFRAWNAPCGWDCYPAIANAGPDLTICDNIPVQIGMTPQYGLKYTWVAENPGTATWLSDLNIANPIFTKPPNGSSLTYYFLTVTNDCGESSSDRIDISYNNGPFFNPLVLVSNIVYGDYISFNVAFSTETEIVIIEVKNLAGALIKSYSFSKKQFACCNFNWKIPDYLFSCEDYAVTVKVKNYCNPNWAQQVVSWPRSKTITTSAFYSGDKYLRNLGPYCRNVIGAQRFEITVMNRYGQNVFTSEGPIANNEQNPCLWNGQCTFGDCSDGTYWITRLNFYNCANKLVIPAVPYFITVGQQLRIGRKDSTLNSDTLSNILGNGFPDIKDEIDVYPNPNAGSFKLFLAEKYTGNSRIYVYGVIGNLVYQSETVNELFTDIDISSCSKGVYYIRIISGNEIITKKVVYQ